MSIASIACLASALAGAAEELTLPIALEAYILSQRAGTPLQAGKH